MKSVDIDVLDRVRGGFATPANVPRAAPPDDPPPDGNDSITSRFLKSDALHDDIVRPTRNIKMDDKIIVPTPTDFDPMRNVIPGSSE